MNKYNYNLNIFKNEDDISFYLLGAYMTDGNIKVNKLRQNSKSIRISSNDIDWLLSIKNLSIDPCSVLFSFAAGTILFGSF